MFVESYMNVSQYSPNKFLEREAIGSVDALPSVKDSLHDSDELAGRKAHREVVFRKTGSVEVDGVTFEFAIGEDGRAVITRCNTDAPSVRVPSAIDGCTVAIVGDHAFSTCYSLSSVELPDTLVEIWEHGFMNTALESFAAPDCLRLIGTKAFFQCAHLATVELNEGLVEIDEAAFSGTRLARLVVPRNVAHIGRDAFRNSNLVYDDGHATLVVDERNERFGLHGGCLYEVTDEGLTLFQVLDEDIVSYEGVAGLAHVAEQAFVNKKRLRYVSLPEGTLTIGEAAFRGCGELSHIDLPDSLRLIGRRAFWGTALESLRIPAGLEAVGAAAFYTGGTAARHVKPGIKQVHVAPGNESFYLEENTLCQRLPDGGAVALLHVDCGEHVVIPRSVTHIGPYAFVGKERVTKVTIHDRLESIDVGGLDFGKGVSTVVYEVTGDSPGRYVINYPPGEAGSQTMRITFGRGNFDIAFAYTECDRAILHSYNAYVRSRMMLERLANPVFLSSRFESMFRSRLLTGVPSAVVEFGRNGYLQGIDTLLEQGFLSEDNIQEAIDAAVAAEEVAVASRLMEIRRTHFGMPMFDFDL